MSPYSGAGFFDFFWVFFQRMFTFKSLVSDEIQLYTLACSALACGLIGPFLVLKRISMFANSLSHTSLIGIVLAFLLVGQNGLLLGALFSALLTAALTATLSRLFRLQEDASIGLVFSSLFALGIVFVSLYARNSHLCIDVVTGNPDALRIADLKTCFGVAVFNGVMILLFYRKFLVSAFDESFAKTLGLSVSFWRSLLYFLTALSCVASFRAVGVLVILALLTGPYLTARLFCHRLQALLFWTPFIGIVACITGVALARALLSSFGLALSTSGIISTIIALFFGCAWMIKRRSAKIAEI